MDTYETLSSEFKKVILHTFKNNFYFKFITNGH